MAEIKTMLPPFPSPIAYWYQTWAGWSFCNTLGGRPEVKGQVHDLYTADQMRAYAEAAVLSANAGKDESPDTNVQRNIDLLRTRSQVGIEKYGTTTDKSGLTHKQWLQHLLEELLDGANYIQAALDTDSKDGNGNK